MFKQKHTEKAKRKIGLAQRGNKHSLGKKHSEEAKRKIGLAQIGNKYNVGRIPWNKDIKWNSEVRKKIRIGRLKKKLKTLHEDNG